jgi:hypothetical protein
MMSPSAATLQQQKGVPTPGTILCRHAFRYDPRGDRDVLVLARHFLSGAKCAERCRGVLPQACMRA